MAFEIHHRRYDEWFVRHAAAYQSELLAVRALLPWRGLGLDIGVGTGRFAAPLGVKVGVDPSMAMLAYAAKRGVLGIRGIAEALPFKDAIFDFGLAVTTICFVDDSEVMLFEARRVLKRGAPLVIGFVNRFSQLGQQYLIHQAENIFYRKARFYSASEVGKLLRDTGFVEQTWAQTLTKPLSSILEMEPFREGRGGEDSLWFWQRHHNNNEYSRRILYSMNLIIICFVLEGQICRISDLRARHPPFLWHDYFLYFSIDTINMCELTVMVMVSQMLQNFIARSRWPGYYSNV